MIVGNYSYKNVKKFSQHFGFALNAAMKQSSP